MAPPLSQFDAPMVLLLSQPLTSQGLELKLEALEELVLLLRLMARADFESSLGFFRTKFLFWGLLTPSFRTRARPAFSSPVCSFRTDPVAKGVWGTVVHCWKVEVLQKKNRREVNCSPKSTWFRSLGRWWGAPEGLSWDSPWSGPSPLLTLRTTPVWGSQTDPNGFAFSCPATLAGLGLRRTVGTHRACWGEHFLGLVKIVNICWQITYKM